MTANVTFKNNEGRIISQESFDSWSEIGRAAGDWVSIHQLQSIVVVIELVEEVT